MAELDPLMESVLRKQKPSGDIGPLMESVMRKDRRKAEGYVMQQFLDKDLAERRAKMGETTGLGDILTFMPAAAA